MGDRRILESWKEIAAYLGHSEKTCRKWEHELGLPVHRLDDSAKAHVSAYADELDRWKAEKLRAEKSRKSGLFFVFAGLSRRTRFWLVMASALVLIVMAGFLVRQIALMNRAPGRPQSVKGVAILPFVDLSPGKEYEYLCDGMVDALINALGSVEGLRVPGRTSAFYFKGKNVPLREIGKKLNVGYVLEASVQVEGGKLRVLPRLSSVADGYQIWSEKYDRGRADIFAIEDDVARMVVENLRVWIMAEKRTPLVKPGTANPEAHNLYLQGRYLWAKRGFTNVQNAAQYFEKAVELDPRYAQGYAGLSMAYVILGDNAFLAPREAFPKARAYAVKALELDDGQAEAHYSLGVVKQAYDWDFAGAEREFKRAMELNPRDGFTRQAYAYLLMDFGKHDEAIKEMRLARDLDPLALRIRANVGFILYAARKYSEAEQVLKEELQLEPQNCAVYDFLAAVYRETGRFELAVEFIRRADECFHPGRNMWLFAAQTASAYARLGKPEEARRILNSIEGPSADGDYDNSYGSRVYLAVAYAWLGDKDKAFNLLEEAYAERDARMTYLKSEPSLDPLRDDPRFTDLLRRIGLEK